MEGQSEAARTAIEDYRRLHESRAYGDTAARHLRFLRPLIRRRAPRSIIDFGCGQSDFLGALGLPEGVRRVAYDPAIPARAARPEGRFDLLVSIDVLEHVPEAALDSVLAEMRALADDHLIVIDTRPAKTLLPDGRNAHCTQHPGPWWRDRLAAHFPVLHQIRAKRGRVGFRTWAIPPGQALAIGLARAGEDLVWGCGEIARRIAGSARP